MKTPSIDHIIKSSGIHPSRVHNIYIFGSTVYGTSSSGSDWDIIMIANNIVDSTEIRNGILNIHVYTPDKFKADLDWHRINNLECIFAPSWAKIKENIKFDNFKINKNKLRHSISQTSSNSWVKCHKKLEVENEYYIGIKSLFHSIRIPMFGTQISENGRIIDYSCANEIWNKIKRKHWTWSEIDREFRPIINQSLSDFRRVTPRD